MDYNEESENQWMETESDYTLPLGPGQSSTSNTLEQFLGAIHGIQEPAQASTSNTLEQFLGAIHGIREPAQASTSSRSSYLVLQEANNTLNTAFMEIITMAREAKTWVLTIPALGSTDEFLQKFRSPPPSGMKVESSIESADISIAPETLVSIMMDVNSWASSLSHIVCRGSGHVPTQFLKQFSSIDSPIRDMIVVNAEFQLPTPFVKTQKFDFLRFKKEIIRNVWAIVDLSNEYFLTTPREFKEQCRRRPSGVIIRKHCDCSQIIWIENVEVYECQSQNNIYSAIINSNLAFCARRWVSTLSWKLKRDYSVFTNVKMQLAQRADTCLLKLTESMKIGYLDCVNESPDPKLWFPVFDNQGIRVLRNLTELGSNSCIGVTSFHVQAKPLTVFNFLVKKNLQLQWPSLEEPEEVINFATYDKSNCITLHKKVVSQNESTEELHEYFLQEASREEFCSFVISAPMSQLEFTDALLLGKWGDVFLQPLGFAIMPDGTGGIQSNASLVTVAMQQQIDCRGTVQAIIDMFNRLSSIGSEINEEVTSWGEASSS